MLFNSYHYLLLFLPATLIIYFALSRYCHTHARLWLALASLFFYGWWNIKYVPLIMLTILVNYFTGSRLGWLSAPGKSGRKKAFLAGGIAFNLLLLAYFKYTDFLIVNLNQAFALEMGMLRIVLPLGISFFTFTQIAYLVDAYRSEAQEYSLLNYFLFISFFPHLLAGPIIHHREMMPQFDSPENKRVDYGNIASGMFLIAIGLFKKIMIADTFAVWANGGFDTAHHLTFLEGWATSLSYTFQIYFDFSGYTDMALGSALLFNIRLPFNFNSPYKALDTQDFWRRWHITLSRFLREYVYIPLGGNRGSRRKVLINLMITFLIGGLWHGAGWTFLFWGLLHGFAVCVHRLWKKANQSMPAPVAWFLTFNFVNVAWVFFRAKSWQDAMKVLKAMSGLNGIVLPPELESLLSFSADLGIRFGSWLANMGVVCNRYSLIELLAFVGICFLTMNSNELVQRFRPKWYFAAFTSIALFLALLNMNRTSEFIYFNF